MTTNNQLKRLATAYRLWNLLEGRCGNVFILSPSGELVCTIRHEVHKRTVIRAVAVLHERRKPVYRWRMTSVPVGITYKSRMFLSLDLSFEHDDKVYCITKLSSNDYVRCTNIDELQAYGFKVLYG